MIEKHKTYKTFRKVVYMNSVRACTVKFILQTSIKAQKGKSIIKLTVCEKIILQEDIKTFFRIYV